MYTIKDFIKKAKEVHGDKYDYSKVNYVNNHTSVLITCPEHGEFWQKPVNHLNGCGCQKCGEIKKRKKHRKTFEDFIKRAKEVHGDKYDYSKVEYTDSQTKVCIICPEHGEFWQNPYLHLIGNKCPSCSPNKKLTTEEFIRNAIDIYGNKYDYSKTVYINAKTKVCIICPEHGEFWKTPNEHISKKSGCPKCHEENKKFYKLLTTEEFIKRAREVHGDKYDYSKVEYKGNQTKVCIICPEHGEFWQTPSNHLRYKGCSKCKSSHLQTKIRQILLKNNISFEEEKIFNFFRNGKSHLSVDFYLPDYSIAIECQGIQHYKPTNFGGKLSLNEIKDNYNTQVERDKRKKELCEQNGIKIVYIDWNEKNIEKIIKNLL